MPCALPWSQTKYSGNHFRRSCETARHLKQTHSATETRRSLAGLAGIKASGENTVRSDTQIMLGHVLQLRGHWSGHRLPRVRPICPPTLAGAWATVLPWPSGSRPTRAATGSPTPGAAVAMTTKVSRGAAGSLQKRLLYFCWGSGLGEGAHGDTA